MNNSPINLSNDSRLRRRAICRAESKALALPIGCPGDNSGMNVSKGNAGSTGLAEGRVEDLYRKYGSIIYSRCRRLLRDDALAQDATQDIFVRVMKHVDSAPSDQAALSWIYRISTNYCLNLIRNRDRQAQPVDQLPELPTSHPEAALLDRELAMKLLSRVPANLRLPAVLYYVDGFEQLQIAKALGVSRRTVVNRLNDFIGNSRKFLSSDESATLSSTLS